VTTNVGNLRRDRHGSVFIVGGVLCDFRGLQTKSGKGPMAFFQLEDQFGRFEVVTWPKTYVRVEAASGLTIAQLL
jgi:DNA polymerase III subunit alpha